MILLANIRIPIPCIAVLDTLALLSNITVGIWVIKGPNNSSVGMFMLLATCLVTIAWAILIFKIVLSVETLTYSGPRITSPKWLGNEPILYLPFLGGLTIFLVALPFLLL